jgi:4-diphosphocytidyl-2-C-methyl-D-erythritol kinase
VSTLVSTHVRASASARAPAKINLGLFVGPARASDGRHELVSVMQSISLADELTLEAIAPGESDGGKDEIVCPGVAGDPRENLAASALRAYREATSWDAGPLRLSILKRIPVAAGLGGGSADAAATLRLARHVSRVEERMGSSEIDELLLRLAGELGADVPAQIAPGRWLATGAGERLRALPAPERELGVLVLPVPVELSTAKVYVRAEEIGIGRTVQELDDLTDELARALAGGAGVPDVTSLPKKADLKGLALLHNDLQEPALSLCPQIAPVLELARGAGADVMFVSGSGPTVVGLFVDSSTGTGTGSLAAQQSIPANPGREPANPGGVPANPEAGLTGPERASRAAERLTGRIPPPICAVSVDAHFARAVDVSVRHNHGR